MGGLEAFLNLITEFLFACYSNSVLFLFLLFLFISSLFNQESHADIKYLFCKCQSYKSQYKYQSHKYFIKI